MFKACRSSLFTALLGWALLSPALAVELPGMGDARLDALGPATASARSCPHPDPLRLDLAATSQTDCCKGHKGVCGCRAGKIVCCDGTVSTSCTCHGDDGFVD